MSKFLMSVYYDTDNPQFIRDWVATARKVGGMRGFQYTTWANSYRNLESFAKTLKEALAQ